MTTPGGMPDPTPVRADAVQSAPLAAALASGDAEQIGRALRLDVVVVPVVRAADGEPQIRVFQPQGGSVELMLFSSSAAFAAFLAGDPNREFDVRRGTDLAGFLHQQRSTISRVIFDPAGPHPVAAPIDAVLDALRPRPDDDDVTWVTGGVEAPGRVVDFRLALPFSGWDREVPADLAAPRSRAAARLVKRVTRASAAAHRGAVAEWAAALLREWAADANAREIAAHAGGRGDAEPAVLALRSWQASPVRPGSEADRALSARDGGVAFDAGGRVPGVRATHRVPAATLPGGAAVVVDYWLPFPDGAGVCLVRFAAPGAHREADVIALCEPVVANGGWVERSAGGG